MVTRAMGQYEEDAGMAGDTLAEMDNAEALAALEAGPVDGVPANGLKGKTADLKEQFPDAEVLTDKEVGKVVACRSCEKPLVVNSFYAPANARCSACKAGKGANVVPGRAERGTVALPRPGITDPAKAQHLRDCLINPQFAFARCPVHPDDEDHEMVLKNVSHSERYGPSEYVGIRNGRPQYRQLATGETVLHQCTRCKAVVTYSTTAQMQLGLQNEVTSNQHANGWVRWLGAQEQAPEVQP